MPFDPTPGCRTVDQDQGVAAQQVFSQILAEFAWVLVLARQPVARLVPAEDVAELLGQWTVGRIRVDKDASIRRSRTKVSVSDVIKAPVNFAFEVLDPFGARLLEQFPLGIILDRC